MRLPKYTHKKMRSSITFLFQVQLQPHTTINFFRLVSFHDGFCNMRKYSKSNF